METNEKQKPSYAKAFEEFRKLGNVNKIYAEVFDQVDKSYLEHVRHVISVGPGPGINDLTFLKKLTPNLVHFTAIETNDSCLNELKDNVKKFLSSDVVVEVHQTKGQVWEGPKSKADLVLLFQVLYFFDESERMKLYKKCFNEWLSPDGKLFILHNKDKHETVNTYFLNDIYRETAKKLQLESFKIKQELIELGYVIEKVYNFEYFQDLKVLNDYVVAFIMINAEPPYENEEIVRKTLKKLINEGNKGYSSGDLFSVIKNNQSA
ncbi:hypothetical protein HELRODRAFT_178496 [Helobdella robusta]|uniref:Methyltransferase domain-containing protein n=1 Tax=Helobdella robusta TaxID=6412 RepID=T1FD95_HELRO|nr:hypothetical protein HELRODRAFT_178496 [Helobdella robusta]ESN97050.1 hypothetical protein HELRODRAFT_178496 [Helobdella robusta]